MKRILTVLAAVVTLTACSAREADTRAEDLQARYAGASGCAARVEAAIVREEETLLYTLEAERTEEGLRITVLEPEALAGIGAVVRDDDALSLEFDGMVLEAGSAQTQVSAVNCVGVFLRAAAEGYIVERGVERYEDRGDALRLCFETEHAGEKLRVTAWFDASDAPLYAEIECDGEILAYLEFTDFRFRDTMTEKQPLD